MKRIVHDPGHGGLDPGATAVGLKEFSLTWAIANKIIWYLKTGYECENRLIEPALKNPKASGKDEVNLVVAEANALHKKTPVDLFISYHVNAGGGTGFESYVARNASQQSVNFQNAIHPVIADYFKKHGLPDRGKKRADFGVIANTKMPAILFELGFIDTEKDRALLSDANFIEGLSKTIADATAQVLELPKLQVPAEQEKDTTNYKKLYETEKQRANKLDVENREMRQVLRNAATIFSPYMIR